MLHKLFLYAVALALCAASATAQVRFNEIFVSHTGTDDREFIEVRGTPGASLSGLMICILEGDSTSNQGGMDVAIDMSAGTFDANGLYTVGSGAIVPPVSQQFFGPSVPNENLFENGTTTYYLISTTNVPAILGQLGSDMRVGGAGTVTIFATDPQITILDLAGFIAPGASPATFDNAPTFMDGTFGPAGIVRCNDAPFGWNPLLLDFDFVADPAYIAVSPGTPNPNCGPVVAPGTGFCFGDGSGLACPCGNNSTPGNGQGCLNSLGQGGKLEGTGTASIAADTVVLTGTLMPNSSALYFQGTNQQGGGAGVAFGDGLRCAGGAIIRLGTKSNAGGTSSYPVGADQDISVRGLVTTPGTRTYQCWYRNAAAFCTPSTFNLSNGYQIAWGA